MVGDGNSQLIEVLPPRYVGTNKTYTLEVALDGVNYQKVPNVKLTVQNEEIKDESEFVECGKKDIKYVYVNYVDEEGNPLLPYDEYKGYTVSMVQAYPIAPKTIEGYTLIKSPTIDWANDFVGNGRTYNYIYRKNPGQPDKPDTPKSFDDVKVGDWYYNSVSFVSQNGLMTGMKDRIFGPAEVLSRAQFAVIIHRMSGSPEVEYKNTFPDVDKDTWYTNAVLWANKNKIITGYGHNGMFGPADLITREQMAVIMYRYAKAQGYDVSTKADFSKFKDAGSVSGFAEEAMQWAVGTGIISGKDNGARLDPLGNASRAECATIIMRFSREYTE